MAAKADWREQNEQQLIAKPEPPPSAKDDHSACMLFLCSACNFSSSVIFDSKWYVLFTLCWAYFAVYLHKYQDWNDVQEFSEHAFREIGVAMSFLLIHRATVAYDIFWGGRAAAGGLAHECRALVRRVSAACSTVSGTIAQQELAAKIRRDACRRCILIFASQRVRLEGRDAGHIDKVIAPFLEFEQTDLTPAEATPFEVMTWIDDDVCKLLTQCGCAPQLIEGVTAKLDKLDGELASFDKLATTFPVPYEQLLNFGMLIFVIILPLPFVDDWHWYIGIPVAMSSGFLFSIEFLARRLFKPFSLDSAGPGVPFFSMAGMGYKLQTQAWATINHHNTDKVIQTPNPSGKQY